MQEYEARATENGGEELALVKHKRMPVVAATAQATAQGTKFSHRPSSGFRTDTFDAWSQHGMRTLALTAKTSPRAATAGAAPGSIAVSTSLLKHAVPAAAAVVEAAICHLMRLIANICELVPSILVTAPYDTERGDFGSIAVNSPSINGVQLLCDDDLLPKLLDFFEAALQYRSAALHAAGILLKMQGVSMMEADIAMRIQGLLMQICRRYFPKIMKSELHEFVCIAPRCLPSLPSPAELHQLVGVAYENIDLAIQQLQSGRGEE
jgi:hypothetical protein